MYVLDSFDALISKLIFFLKKIILIHFSKKHFKKQTQSHRLLYQITRGKEIIL